MWWTSWRGYRFIDQLSHFLKNYVRPTVWVVRVKATAQRASRAYDSVVETERACACLLHTEVCQVTGRAFPPSRGQWGSYDGAITEKLTLHRGMSWEERLRVLIVEHRRMSQSRHECVQEYARRYRENDHMLRKFILDRNRLGLP